MNRYIHQQPQWPDIHWDETALNPLLADIRHQQGLLLGRMAALGFDIKQEAYLEMLTQDVTQSSAIEGENLDPDQVRSSLAKNLGLDTGGLPPASRHIDGIVEMMLDATHKYQEPLTEERLCGWHCALFPTGRSGLRFITVGTWRTAASGPMQVVSGPMGREHVHFEAPLAERLPEEMTSFLDWLNHAKGIDPLLKAGAAHFWFVTLHPFEDGNGRIARAIADMCLAQADGMPERFYSMSTEILKQRKAYYDILEKSQKGFLDITPWLKWFLRCLQEALHDAKNILKHVLYKAALWQQLASHPINERQRKVLNRLLGPFEGKLTTQKYAKLANCSHDTALRDIQALIKVGALEKLPGGGRSVGYALAENSR